MEIVGDATLIPIKNRFVLVLLVVSIGATAPHGRTQSGRSKTVTEKEVELVRKVAPIYPDDARQARTEGSVHLQIIIGTDGAVKSLRVLQGPPSLVPAAADAVRQWRYKPYMLNGKPTEVESTVTVTFALDAPVVEILPCGNDVALQSKSSEATGTAIPQGRNSIQQVKAHFAAAKTAQQEAKQIESQLKSRASGNRDQLRAKFGSACGAAVTEFRLADQLTEPNDKVNHSTILAQLASIYALAGRHKDAAVTYQLAIDWKPSSELYGNMVAELAKDNKLVDATAACENAIKLDPNIAATCRRNIGITLYNAGNFEEAVGYFEQASAVDPKSALGWYLLGDSLRKAPKSDKTSRSRGEPRIAEAFQRCLQLDPEGPYAERAKMALKEMHIPTNAP